MSLLMPTLTNSSENMKPVIPSPIKNSEKQSSVLSMGIYLLTYKISHINISPFSYRTDHYNRVDKINMNNLKIVSPEKTGKQHFRMADEVKQPTQRQLDDHLISEQERHTAGVYLPKKGASKIKGQVD